MVTVQNISDKTDKIALVGLGYVGLPLAAAFGKVADVVGFDISEKKIEELKGGYDATGELSSDDLDATRIDCTADAAKLAELCVNGNGRGVVVDVKSALERDEVEKAGLVYWGL